jgi:hypothetical protein
MNPVGEINGGCVFMFLLFDMAKLHNQMPEFSSHYAMSDN